MTDNSVVGHLLIAKTMTEVGSLGVRGLSVSPDSDCNSNHHGSASYLSNTSSASDFIQDNSDYQWFLDYGYRDGAVNHHTSILSLPESYEYYDTFAKNMDANLAEADMESFRTEDIHALLTNLPPMCTDHLSQDNNRQGESYASVSGSMMAKFDFDSSSSPQSSSHGEDSTSMSIYKSELLFSPVKELPPMPGANFSVDSLDCDMMLTCQANKDNYTIAFEGSTLYSEDSDYHDNDKENTHWTTNKQVINKITDTTMTQSDSGSFTTWSKMKKRNCCDKQLRRHPSGNNNNNNSGDDSSLNENSIKSQSMPNLFKQKLKNLGGNGWLRNQNQSETIHRKPVKVFDIQHQSSSISDMATSFDATSTTSDTTCNNKHQQPSFSLVKLFMKQKSLSTEIMSTTMDQLSSTENWQSDEGQSPIINDQKSTTNETSRTYDLIAEEPEEDSARSESVEQLSESIDSIGNSFEKEKSPEFNINNNYIKEKISMNRSIQTSQFSEMLNLKNLNKKQKFKIIEPSFLNKLQKESENQKSPVYVLYPNYVLPNLDFLNDKKDDIVLVPQEAPKLRTTIKRRPFSCNDVEMLKKKGFSHVKDWDSLNFLLPPEYKNIFMDSKQRRRHYSCDTSSSSGYRGSSTILTDSQNSPANLNPLFVYRYDNSVTSSDLTTAPPLPTRCTSLQNNQIPPRPPLPKSILRREKRFSLYETSEEDLTEDTLYNKAYFLRKKRFSETEDEGVDAGASSSSIEETNHRTTSPNIELKQLEEFLKISGISTDSDDLTEDNLMQLKSYVGKFLALKINQDGEHFGGKKSVSFAEKVNVLSKKFVAPNNSPNVSAFCHIKTLVDTPICEESENSSSSPQTTPIHKQQPNLVEKRSLINAVTDAVDQIITHFSTAKNQSELNALGDSTLNPMCAKLALSTLCPALYAILSDGLKPTLETSFGAINNSVWQLVEASAQQGPLTKALNELVMRINSEDAITEGLVKFNAFVFGLLNVRSLDAWMSYLKTRESVLKKHYTKESLLIMSYTGGLNVRTLLDSLIASLQPLALLPFQLDLLFEYRQLHLSFKRMVELSPKKERPRSCIDTKPNFKLGDVTSVAKKRWSGISANSKLYLVYDRLAKEEDEEYTDSLENNVKNDETLQDGPESLESNISDEKPINGRRFKKLQQKWEMLSGRESSSSPPASPTNSQKSKIPRPVISPVKPSGIPVLISPIGKQQQQQKKKISASKIINNNVKRTSRVDQLENGGGERHLPRPSSLPYKSTTPKSVKVSPPRRAASSSMSRKPTTISKQNVPKVVRTLSHRVPSESGHLSYNEGERLKVVLEVDDKWLLCCRGSQKGLVPRSAVIATDGTRFVNN